MRIFHTPAELAEKQFQERFIIESAFFLSQDGANVCLLV